MKISLPKSDYHSQLEITLKHAKGAVETMRLDNTHTTLDIEVEDDTEVSCRFIGNDGKAAVDVLVLKAAKLKPAPVPKRETYAPKVEPKPEPKVEFKSEPKSEDKDE